MLDHITFSYIPNRAESLRDWERFQDLVSALLLPRIQVNSSEGENQAKEDTSYRPVTRKVRLPELHNSLPGLDCWQRHKKR
jgi:hypothetical protein